MIRPRPPAFAREIGHVLAGRTREREPYEFLAAVAHELRTPLASIRGYLETLLEGDLDSSTQQRFVRTAAREASRLGRLIDGMLDFSLLDLSGPNTRLACDLAEQITLACETMAPLAARRKMRFECEVMLRICVRLGADSCAHVLINLLDNAVKYGREGGRVRIACGPCPPYARVRIDDDGVGVARGELRRIFGYGARGSAAGGPGHGMGLTIVKAVVERAGGKVKATRSPLGGARFELHIPMRAEFPEAMS